MQGQHADPTHDKGFTPFAVTHQSDDLIKRPIISGFALRFALVCNRRRVQLGFASEQRTLKRSAMQGMVMGLVSH